MRKLVSVRDRVVGLFSTGRKEAEEHSLTGIPSDSRVPEDVLREHGVCVNDDGVVLLRRVEATIEQRDEVLGHVPVASFAAFRLFTLFVIARQQVVHRQVHVQICTLQFKKKLQNNVLQKHRHTILQLSNKMYL